MFTFTYRGSVEEWSQLYHLDSDFASHSDFTSTWGAFLTAVKPLIDSTQHLVRVYGYHDTDDAAAYTDLVTASNAGTLSGVSLVQQAGDSAWWIRWDTERTNSRGRRIFLRKYFHPGWSTSGTPDVLNATVVTNANTFAAAATGTGWNGHHLAGPDGNVPGGGALVSTYITTRTLHRR